MAYFDVALICVMLTRLAKEQSHHLLATLRFRGSLIPFD
jgi:hypothetical protein